MTLLTGPHLLSPPTRPLDSSRISSEVVQRGTPANEREEYLLRLRQQVQDAKARAEAARAKEDASRAGILKSSDARLRLAPGQTEPTFAVPPMMPTPESLRFGSPPESASSLPSAAPTKSPTGTPLPSTAPGRQTAPVTPTKPE